MTNCIEGNYSVVWHGLWFGYQRRPVSAKRAAVERYLNEVVAVSMLIFSHDQTAAEWHAAERARLTTKRPLKYNLQRACYRE